ncbi:MAG: hypothetical protein AB7I30_07190, partial [Isosphaeraceae bacterium]
MKGCLKLVVYGFLGLVVLGVIGAIIGPKEPKRPIAATPPSSASVAGKEPVPVIDGAKPGERVELVDFILYSDRENLLKAMEGGKRPS